MTSRRTRTVAISGGGIAAFAAAIAFRRALPEARVIVFEGGGRGPDYVGAAASYIHQFHALVGIDHALFRSRTGAVVAPEAEIRRAGQAPFRFVPLAEVQHVDGAALHQLWLRRTGAADGPAWADVARRGRRQEDAAQGLGVRFDAQAYLALLRDVAGRLGTVLSAEAATRADSMASNDLVIDALDAGPTQAGWQRVEGLPARVRWSGPEASTLAPGAAEIVEIPRAQAHWRTGAWDMTGQVEAGDGPAGRVTEPMGDNVLAIGRAAVQCETFDGQPLAVALAGIVRALHLLPRPGASGGEAAEYNRRSGIIHDFLLDWAAERRGMDAAPDGLAALRGQFSERGRIPFRDEDPVPSGHWLSWLLGSGARPRHVDLTAMAMPETKLAEMFAGL